MTTLAEPLLAPGLNLSPRQRAMLKDMGVQVWQRAAKVDAPASQSSHASQSTHSTNSTNSTNSTHSTNFTNANQSTNATQSSPFSAAATPLASAQPNALGVASNAIDSGAAGARIQRATGTFDTQNQAFYGLKAAPVDPPAQLGPDAWRIGQLQTLYAKSAPETAARWLILLESPAGALHASFNPFEGDAGKLLDNMLRAAKLHTAGAAMLVSLVRGNDMHNGAGSHLSAALADVFASAKADVVLVMGRLAAQALLQSTEPLGKLRGQIHSLHSTPTIITIEPAYLLRNPLDKAKAWDDLCLAMRLF